MSQKNRVMTWVPPYAVSQCSKRLNETYSGIGMKHGITHLGLQFWNPTSSGNIRYVTKFNTINDSTVRNFQRWGKAHNIRVMLCIYNGSSSEWNWNLAESAFGNHRSRLINALVKECRRLNLHGVDIDFEGKGNQASSKHAYIRFIAELSQRLHAEGRELTVDSHAYKWGVPNQSWWPQILPHVDALHVMGYAETGAGAAGWRSYSHIKAAAGRHASKVAVGVPGYEAAWQNRAAITHLKWLAYDGTMGLAIWDAQLKNPVWRSKATWIAVAGIKTPKGRRLHR
ncbi:MAG: glycosyl hydrolase family 18 protein [Kiritimatiellia bacterium]